MNSKLCIADIIHTWCFASSEGMGSETVSVNFDKTNGASSERVWPATRVGLVCCRIMEQHSEVLSRYFYSDIQEVIAHPIRAAGMLRLYTSWALCQKML